MTERFTRPRRGSWIGGVCAGIADFRRMLVRLLFVLPNGAGLLVWTCTKVEPKR